VASTFTYTLGISPLHLIADDEDDNTLLYSIALYYKSTTNLTYARDYYLSDNEREAINKFLE
jgi:hypothetical protein